MALALHAFAYDDFQQTAIAAVEAGSSVLVSAPTGAGKTVIAEYIIHLAFARHERVLYTAPVKALSNQKYRDFRARYGEEAVGIVTGDVVLNPTAPLRIMTTEIYRNTLLEDPERLRGTSWVIFDEVHYLDDPDRGTVWEEAILLTPPAVKLLALSATIPNAQELAAWLEQVHHRQVRVVETTHRPVPLQIAFQCQGEVLPTAELLRSRGYLHREQWRESWRPRRRGHVHHALDAKPNRIDRLVKQLLLEDRLPAIYFAFGRRWAEELAGELAHAGLPFLRAGEREALLERYATLCRRYEVTQERSAEDLRAVLQHGIAYHHAGMLPTLKEVVEQLFTSRLIKLIITTETFALGINMPARSVILDTLRKRTEGRWETIMCREFFQMAGRAGRRGMDRQGSVYVRINPHQVSFAEVMRVVQGQPEPVRSRFNTAYATLLNLYRDHQRGLLALYPTTLHHFQSSPRQREEGIALIERKLTLLEELEYVAPAGLTAKGQFAAWMYGYELLLTALHEQGILERESPQTLAILLAGLIFEPRPGRLPPKRHPVARRFEQLCHPLVTRIHHLERRLRIHPRTKPPVFSLAAATEAWSRGASFERAVTLAGIDEGELVRTFRMVIQLLRQLERAPVASPALRATASEALRRINRDVVDAEKQLRSG